ncbi:hypothetical protein [Actinomyces procaprae]|uniref:hypothetical protein n=1 Tax=Actinomyces procaprae TaxID=2560010 RepID=UPI001B34CD6F|nr:hypothetical protein [Actinomyces procaprae]
MSVKYTILPPGPTELIIADRDTFIAAAQRQWPGCRTFLAGHGPHDSDVDVFPIFDGEELEVCHFPDNQTIGIDGLSGTAAVADVAAWVRSLNPDPELALWLTDDFFQNHVILTPGITPAQIDASWVNHAEHNPMTEYPQYFADAPGVFSPEPEPTTARRRLPNWIPGKRR